MKYVNAFKWLSVILVIAVMIPAIGCGKKEAQEPTPTSIPSATFEPTATATPTTEPTSETTPTPSNTELEGTWTGTSPNANSPIYTFIFSGNTYTLIREGNQSSGTVTIDSAANPKTIDLHVTAHFTPEYIGKTALGLYVLNGTNLTLTLTQPPGATPRPISVTVGGGGTIYNLVKQ